jgi:hypothetical protein
MKLILGTIAAFLLVPICGILLGLVQLAWFRMRVRGGSCKAEDIPFFGALMLRGMLLTFVLLAVGGIYINLTQGPGVALPQKAP